MYRVEVKLRDGDLRRMPMVSLLPEIVDGQHLRIVLPGGRQVIYAAGEWVGYVVEPLGSGGPNSVA